MVAQPKMPLPLEAPSSPTTIPASNRVVNDIAWGRATNLAATEIALLKR